MPETMTSIERFQRILEHKPVDRIGLHEHFWNDTHKEWVSQGHLKPEESFSQHFGYDIDESWAFDMTADLDFVPVVIDETEDTVTKKDGNGAILRRHKKHDSTPEHVGFTVQEREQWDEIKHLLTPSERRINFKDYREKKELCRQQNRFFTWSGVNVFEQIHPLCGHENLLVGMALDPEWVSEMAEVYSGLTINLMEILFAKEGKPDGIWFYEDMGYKNAPFMSPEMYRELIFPAHQKTISYAHSLGLPVVMHSCGFVEPLLPDMVRAGIDCLQAMEVKAGMDLLRIHRNFGEKIALMGGLDVRSICSNDRAWIDRELMEKIPEVKQGFGFVLHSDHSIPKTVEYENYCYFVRRGLELGTYQ